ncbi:MAG TPA: hypothetical protein VII38_18320 [Polyangia bacterium]
MRLFWIILAVLVLATAAGAAPAPVDAVNRARAHYEIGLGMYRLGDYQGALREFLAGYELTRKPGFLLNAGQTYRKLHDLVHARELYRRYLAQAAPEDPARAQVQQVLAELEAELRTQTKAATPPEVPPDSSLPPSAPSTAPPIAPSIASPAAPRPEASPPMAIEKPAAALRPKRSRALRIAGLTLGIAGVGALGGGLGAALAADQTARELNALDRNQGTFDGAKDDRYGIDRGLEGALFGVGAALSVTAIVLLVVGR